MPPAMVGAALLMVGGALLASTEAAAELRESDGGDSDDEGCCLLARPLEELEPALDGQRDGLLLSRAPAAKAPFLQVDRTPFTVEVVK